MGFSWPRRINIDLKGDFNPSESILRAVGGVDQREYEGNIINPNTCTQLDEMFPPTLPYQSQNTPKAYSIKRTEPATNKQDANLADAEACCQLVNDAMSRLPSHLVIV